MAATKAHVVELLPGRSAFDWTRIEPVIALTGWVSAVIATGCAVAGLEVHSAFWAGTAVFGLYGIVAIALNNTSTPSRRRQKLEAQRGYATIPSPHEPELALVLPDSGTVLCKRRGKAVDWDAYRAAVAAERAGRA